jgi:hypothetical protein
MNYHSMAGASPGKFSGQPAGAERETNESDHGTNCVLDL